MKSRYEELIAWQKAMHLAADLYTASRSFPADERYGLTSQMRRAAVSVPSNIAEGHGKSSNGEFKLFLGHARGSLYEVATQMRLAQTLGFLPAERAEELLDQCSEVARLINGLMAAIR